MVKLDSIIHSLFLGNELPSLVLERSTRRKKHEQCIQIAARININACLLAQNEGKKRNLCLH